MDIQNTNYAHDVKKMYLLWNRNTSTIHYITSTYTPFCLITASAMTCFETRLGCLDCAPDSLPQQMLDATVQIFELSLKLWFGLPWFKLFNTPTWKRLMGLEDLFFG
jgi:hypothetical protein